MTTETAKETADSRFSIKNHNKNKTKKNQIDIKMTIKEYDNSEPNDGEYN